MAKKPKKKPTYTKNPGLSQAKAPTLIKPNGDRIVAQSELTQLQQKREQIQSQLEEVDTQILELKNKRKEELLEELKALGLDVVPKTTASASSGDNKKKGTKKTLDKPCKICGFLTEPYHDARLKTHRDQGDNKRPLTDAELAAAKLKKVEAD